MLPNEEDFNLEDSQQSTDTERYLKHVENSLYSDIEARKRIDSGLLFLACQVGSCSLSWLFFSMQISASLILAISSTIALIPGLVDASESFNFELSSERWQIRHDKPLVALSKLALGGVINWHGSQQILQEIWHSEDEIKATYSEIRQASKDNLFTLPQHDLIPILGGLIGGIVLMSLMTRKSKDV